MPPVSGTPGVCSLNRVVLLLWQEEERAGEQFFSSISYYEHQLWKKKLTTPQQISAQSPVLDLFLFYIM